MLAFLFLLGLALCAVSPSEEQAVEPWQNSCPMFWTLFNCRCYKYISTDFTWADAELNCVSLGGNLVSIRSQEEENFVKTLIKSFDPAEGYTWNGLNDIPKEGRWMWSDGSAVNFVSWSSGQPDNKVNEDCGHTNYGSVKKWNDRPCSDTSPSVCASRITCF
ncbi:alpha-N-acetylgalactosamine-specific lectin-like [Trematomus bernacchii]|uniref:alpha-N-acetylgalactosamine-specific lectin-like n=1 Tax=Trematomus bernacchii TaxID=40690 RepID=UPI00146BE4F9|nr:alpha-N-acetylgalactosamine-specific lectin-like [Trematomus bernacchii]